MKIKDIMSSSIITANINDSVYDVANLMVKYDIGFLPIEENNKIIGVITDRDIVARGVSTNIEPDDNISKIISKSVISIDKNKDIEESLSLMSKEKIKRLIVTDEDKVIGIISLSDINENCSDCNSFVKALNSIFVINRNIHSDDIEVDTYYL